MKYKKDAEDYKKARVDMRSLTIALEQFCKDNDVTIDEVGYDVYWNDLYVISNPMIGYPVRGLVERAGHEMKFLNVR